MNFILYFVTIAIFFAASITRPSSAQCPEGWFVNGIREGGDYGCRPRSLKPDHPSRGHEPDDAPDPDADREVFGRIYCTGGSSPIVVNGSAVGCQPGGWR